MQFAELRGYARTRHTWRHSTNTTVNWVFWPSASGPLGHR